MTPNDAYTDHGVVRIHFPFGQVEMDIRNEAELERMVEMAKHMLKVHEENEATAAIRGELDEKKPGPESESMSVGLAQSATAFVRNSNNTTVY